MDGIHPTLALAALFLGLAGHPRDAAEGAPEHQWAQQVHDLVECSEIAVAGAERDASFAPRDLNAGPGPRAGLARSMLSAKPVGAEVGLTPEVDLSTEILDGPADCDGAPPQP